MRIVERTKNRLVAIQGLLSLAIFLILIAIVMLMMYLRQIYFNKSIDMEALTYVFLFFLFFLLLMIVGISKITKIEIENEIFRSENLILWKKINEWTIPVNLIKHIEYRHQFLQNQLICVLKHSDERILIIHYGKYSGLPEIAKMINEFNERHA